MKRNSFIGLLIAALLFGNIVLAAPVPDTGVTKCYDTKKEIVCPKPGELFYGQDGNYTINPMSYTKLDSSGNALPDSAASWVMVKDNVTGLIWEIKTNKDGVKNYTDPHDADNTYTWYDSNPATNGGDAGTPGDGTDTEDFIKALNDAKYGGFSDWRMPTIKELTYIINYRLCYMGPSLNTVYFPNTISSNYWSSTTCAYHTIEAWDVSFYSGSENDHGKYKSYYVRAVRGGQSGAFGDLAIESFINISDGDELGEMFSAGSYTDNGDGTVTDVSTGLMWQQNLFTGTWKEALAYCEGLNLGGYTDWRLPNNKELRTLVDYSRYDPVINTSFFSNSIYYFCWSSTTHETYTYSAWCLESSFGLITWGAGDKNNRCDVRAVRGGQSGSLGNLVISPLSRPITKDAGTTTFSVSNSGTGTMSWTAAVTSGSTWLRITSGSSGTNAGTILCGYDANTTAVSRAGTIRITAPGATGSPKDVTVTQAAGSTTSAQVTSLWPVNNAHAGSTSTLWADVKNTGSSALPSNALVWYYVSGPNWTNYWVGYASASGLSSGSTKWYSYNWSIPSTATPGTYTYWARVYQGSTALSNWSAAQSFTVGSNQKAVMTSPVNGSQLASTTQTFTWTSVSGATQYWLYLGSTISGYNIYNQSAGTSTSRTVTGLSSNGSMIYARLWTQYGGVWRYNDYSYKSY